MFTVYFSTVDIVDLLIREGADIDAKNNNGETALMYAAKRGCLSTLAWLLERGADVTAKDKDGKTAIDWAEGIGCEQVVKLLNHHKESDNA